MQERYRPRRDFQGLENRRKQAAKLSSAGVIMAAVARTLQASRQSVSRWYRDWKRGGVAALRGAGRAGRKPKLDRGERQRVDRALRKGARAHGFATERWTLARVTLVIERVTGAHYHPGHVWKILRDMDWSLPRPAKRARERNEDAVRQWISKRWPAVKKTPSGAGPGSFSRTKAASRNNRRSAGRGRRKAKPRC